MRLAWFTPLAPVPSGIASYSAMVLPAVAEAHTVELFVDDPVWTARAAERIRSADGFTVVPSSDGTIFPAHDFLPRHLGRPYDLVVYQMGNAGCHDYMWAYAVRYPGLLVLHDAQLHQSRAAALLRQGRKADYRAEFAACHPGTPTGVADWVIAGFGNAGAPLWPLTGVLLRASRAVAVHFDQLAAELREAHPDVGVHTIRLGSPDLLATSPAPADPAASDRPLVLAAFGLITPEKRIPQILRALGEIRRTGAPPFRLRLVGAAVPHYDVRADAVEHGVADLVDIVGYVDDAAFDRHIVESDVCCCLRWPTNREASGPWIRALAAGKPTIVNDLTHLVDVPTLDPRTWEVIVAPRHVEDALRPPRPDTAVAVSIDILDEDHSLTVALRRLVRDAPLRAALGAAARRFWAREHTLAAMAADYARVIAAAAATPRPAGARDGLPPHLLADGTATLRRLAADCGVAVDWVG
jgi:glycosyltransferase involved in cell wall biosynthesis